MRRFASNKINTKRTLTSWFFDPYNQEPPVADATQASCKFQIRAATSADLTGITQIIAESFHSQNGFWGWAFPLLRLGIYEDFRHRLLSSAPHHICLVAVDTTMNKGNTLVGTVEMGMRLSDSWTQDKNFLYLSNLAVHPKYRRHGVASRLLIGCEEVSKDWGFHDLYLHVLENNSQARQLYFKLGYQVCSLESNLNSFLLRRSRQILLHKHLSL